MKIVVRGTNWIGDAVMQIPALRFLRSSFPEAEITLCTREWTAPLFRGASFIDHLLPIAQGESVFAQARRWRKECFDLAVLFTNSTSTALVSKLARTPRRFGYAADGRSILLSDALPVPQWKNSRHEVYYYLNLVRKVAASYGAGGALADDVPVLEVAADSATAVLEKAGTGGLKPLVSFCPGSTNSRAKRWSAESYAALGDRLHSSCGAQIMLIGSENDANVSAQVSGLMWHRPIILTGKTSLGELIGILQKCDLLVTNDTGPAHIGAAVGTSTIVVFGPTNPKTTAPMGAEIVRENVECSPCMLRDCPIDHRCMTRVTVERVYELAKARIETGRPPKPAAPA
jgi:heptosyltransferase II